MHIKRIFILQFILEQTGLFKILELFLEHFPTMSVGTDFEGFDTYDVKGLIYPHKRKTTMVINISQPTGSSGRFVRKLISNQLLMMSMLTLYRKLVHTRKK